MMIWLYLEQFCVQFIEGLCVVYLLFGNDFLLLQESQDVICEVVVVQGFIEYYIFLIDNSIDWQVIFVLSQVMSLFVSW